MTTKDDVLNPDITKLMYCVESKSLKEWDGIERPFWSFHHTVKQQKLKRNPELYKHLKLIYFPPINQPIKTIGGGMGCPHLEADAYHSKYKERWGVELEEVIYRGR